jgi:hypothetical protein
LIKPIVGLLLCLLFAGCAIHKTQWVGVTKAIPDTYDKATGMRGSIIHFNANLNIFDDREIELGFRNDGVVVYRKIINLNRRTK